jgi:uncharacterized protein YjbI with pentapeptide repeats
LATIANTAFRDVTFKGCKMLGLQFDGCNQFGLSIQFQGCQLNLSSFYKLRLRNTKFNNCTLHEVDFTDADLTGVAFTNCDLLGAKFENTILEKTDFRTAHNYSFDPEINRVRKAKFSFSGIPGLLDKYQIDIE